MPTPSSCVPSLQDPGHGREASHAEAKLCIHPRLVSREDRRYASLPDVWRCQRMCTFTSNTRYSSLCKWDISKRAVKVFCAVAQNPNWIVHAEIEAVVLLMLSLIQHIKCNVWRWKHALKTLFQPSSTVRRESTPMLSVCAVETEERWRGCIN